jgi:predicted Zn-dependent protease
MTLKRMAVALACVLAIGVATAGAQPRGKAKAEGRVLDEAGEPLEGAIVAALMEGFDKPFQQAKTNRRGEWSIDNLAAGKWRFFFGGIDGLDEANAEVQIGQSGSVKVADVTLAKPVDHQAYINTQLQSAAEMMQTRQPQEARKIYLGVIEKYPMLPEDFRGQLHGAVAQTFAMENQVGPALEHLKQAVELDPANTDIQVVYGEMLIQADRRAEGEKVLMGQDITQIKDPFPYMNLVIFMINEKRTDEALGLLEKLVKQFPAENTLYYYRGRAYIAADKLPEARADLQKFVAAAPPDARELPDAKNILEQLKDVK